LTIYAIFIDVPFVAQNRGLTMRHAISCVGAALAATLFSLPALAATCGNSGGPGVWIDVSGATSCAQTGNGLVLDTVTDPFKVFDLDTTKTGDNRAPVLTVVFSPISLTSGFQTDGTFSFNTAGLTNVKLGFQLNTIGGILNPTPDWFIFNLPNGTGSGGFDADFAITANGFELPSDPILYAVLYGQLGGNQNETPIPGAVWLLGSVLGGGAGIKKWRNRRRKAALAAA
jgi:hypothetical protein